MVVFLGCLEGGRESLEETGVADLSDKTGLTDWLVASGDVLADVELFLDEVIELEEDRDTEGEMETDRV